MLVLFNYLKVNIHPRQLIQSDLGHKINKISAILVSQLVVIMNLGLSAVLFLSSLTFSKHLSDAQFKVPDPFPCGSGLQLIPADARCDGYPDCPGSEDEHGCLPPHQEVQLTRRPQAGYQVRQQSAASKSSYNWQRDFHKNDAVIKHSRPGQPKHTLISQNGGKLGTSIGYRQQQTYGIKSLSNKGDFEEKWIHENLGSNHHEKSNFEGVALEKNSVNSRSWIMNSAMQQQHMEAVNSADNKRIHNIQSMNTADNKMMHNIQSMNTADNKRMHNIQSMNTSDNKRMHNIQSMNTADNKRMHNIQIQSINTADNKRLHNIQTMNTADNKRLHHIYAMNNADNEKLHKNQAWNLADNNRHNRITIQRQEHFHVPQESATKVHHNHDRYGRHGGGYQTHASGTGLTSRIDQRVFQFPTNMKMIPPKYHRVDSQHLTHVQHIDKPREGFHKPVALKQDTAQSWAKDRWTISILVVLTCISMFSMIVQCWFCK